MQETADGIAELRGHGLPVGGVVVNQVRPRDLDDDDLTAIRAGKVPKKQVSTDLTRGRPDRAPPTLVDGPARRGPRPRRAAGARGRPAGGGRDARASRRTSCPLLVGGDRPRRALRAGRRCCATRGWHEHAPMSPAGGAAEQRQPSRSGRASARSAHGRPAARRRRAARRPAHRDHRVLRLRGVGKTTTSAALALRAAERGRKVVVLTIDPARRLAQSMGIEALDNTPRPGRRRRPRARRRQPRRDDARHEAHLRRGGREPGQPREGASRSSRTRSTSRCRARSRGRRSTWRWRSSARSTPTRSATAPTT